MHILNHPIPIRWRLLIAMFSLAGFAVVGWPAFALLHPIPETTVVMAMYPEGSLNAELVKRYRDILGRDGIHKQLEHSSGPLRVSLDCVTQDPRPASHSFRRHH
jgi:hypothetical protein